MSATIYWETRSNRNSRGLEVEALSSYLYKQIVKEQFSPNRNLKEFKKVIKIKTTSLSLKEASFFYKEKKKHLSKFLK